jgi:type III secretion protein D
MKNTITGEIVLLTGEQAGARARLKSNSSISVSGNLGTDIVIRDKKISNEVLKLFTEDNKVFLQIVSGNIKIDGRTIDHNKKIRLMDDAKVKIGSTVFVHQKILNVPLSEIYNHYRDEEKLRSNKQTLQTENKFTKHIFIFGASVVFVLVTIPVYFAVTHGMQRDKLHVSVDQQALSLLRKNGFDDLNVTRNNNDQIVISGYVLSYKNRAVLEKIIDDNSIPAVHELKIGDQLAKEVVELFRINGVDIEAVAIDEGIVSVRAEDRDAELADRIKNIALEEIVDLQSLEIEYNISDTVNKSIGEDMTYNENDKKITMVVDGNPAYILTSDDAKYYIGALLPTGYKIIDILAQQVILEKHGKQTTLNF